MLVGKRKKIEMRPIQQKRVEKEEIRECRLLKKSWMKLWIYNTFRMPMVIIKGAVDRRT